MLNVVFTGEFTYPEGLAGTKRIQHFIDYLAKENRVRVLLLHKISYPDKHRKIINNNHGIEYAILGSELGMSIRNIFQIPLTLLSSCSILWRWKKKKMKNILYVYNGITIENLIVVLFARVTGYRIVVDYVEDLSFYGGKLPAGIKIKNYSNVILERTLPCLAQGVVVISHYLLRKFRKYEKKIPIVHIPISALVQSVNQQVRPFGKPVIIAYSGTFGAKDGLEALITAFVAFTKDFPESCLYLTGKSKNPENISKHLKSEKIKYMGYIPDGSFYDFLANADILCITRNNMQFANAGFPFKLGEYLATGRPVITSNVCDIDLYLENSSDAMIVDPENPDQICSALLFLVNNQDKAQEIGKNGQMKCLEHFNPLTNGKLLLNFLYTIK